MKQYRHVVFAVIASLVAPMTTVANGQRAGGDLLDPATGARMRSFRTAGGAAIELETPHLVIRKETAGQAVITTVRGGGDELVIEARRGAYSVRANGQRVEVTKGDRAAFERAQRLAQQARLADRASALIGRMSLNTAAPMHSVLVTTRAFLLALAGDDSGPAELRAWAGQVRAVRMAAPVRVNASLDQKTFTPTECWDAYTKEAIAAWIEYEQCLDDVSWWDLAGMAACLVIYEMRAIGAFAWWTSCVTLRT